MHLEQHFQSSAFQEHTDFVLFRQQHLFCEPMANIDHWNDNWIRYRTSLKRFSTFAMCRKPRSWNSVLYKKTLVWSKLVALFNYRFVVGIIDFTDITILFPYWFPVFRPGTKIYYEMHNISFQYENQRKNTYMIGEMII